MSNQIRQSLIDSAVLGGREYQSHLKDLENYFMLFTLYSAKNLP